MTIATAGALALFVGVAEPLLGFVYGSDFRAASDSLVLLLPGAVLFAGAAILNAGIYAAGRPFTATCTQILGMLVTIVGLGRPSSRTAAASRPRPSSRRRPTRRSSSPA